MEFKFEGIDDWNRPIFKNQASTIRLSNVDILFSWGATEDEVLEKIDETQLTYHGSTFDCEPMGTAINPNKIKIVKEFTK